MATSILAFIVRYVGGGILAYAAPRLLVAMGIPLDRWIIAMGAWLSLRLNRQTALWGATLILGALLFAGSFINWPRVLALPASQSLLPPPATPPLVGRIAHFQFSEREITSSNPDLPYSLQITILTDQIIEKPAFLITCNGPIAQGQAGVGAGMYTMTQNMITDDKLSFGFRWATPNFTPETPLIVTLFSKSEIHLP